MFFENEFLRDKSKGKYGEQIVFDYYNSIGCNIIDVSEDKEYQQKDIDFLIETLEKDMIREYYNRKWYLECFYLLAMVDYISREIGAPLCSEYDDLRQQRLQKLVYPAGVIVTANVLKNDQIKEEAVKNSIPEFLRHNIVESEVRNVI